ncbi:MAG: TolB family protein [Opitutales bacterium]
MKLASTFPRYGEYEPQVPVWCLTPKEGRCIHRFFDTPALSPSNRFAAVTRFPFEDRLPRPGEKAAIVLIDLETGTEKVVYETAGWETQLGANLNWGVDDSTLFFNDTDLQTWQPVTVRLNPHTGNFEKFGRGVYHVSPDGKWALCAALERTRRTQFGYGVMIPDEKVPIHWDPPADTGLYLTSLETGECRLLLSLADFIQALIPEHERPAVAGRCYYGFHAQWSPAGTHLLFTVRGVHHAWALGMSTISNHPLHFYIATMAADGSDLKLAMGASFWNRPGHHTRFTPDGLSLTCNNQFHYDRLHFVIMNRDGSDKRLLIENVHGSGHPTLSPDQKFILTDTYTKERAGPGDGTSLLRWIDLETGSDRTIVRIRTSQPSSNGALRIDPHPAWDRSGRFVVFNGAPDGQTRRVFLADLGPLLGG